MSLLTTKKSIVPVVMALFALIAGIVVAPAQSANAAASVGRAFTVVTAPTADQGQGFGAVSVIPNDSAAQFPPVVLTAELQGPGTFSANGAKSIDFTFEYTKTSSFNYQCVDPNTTIRVFPIGTGDTDWYPPVPVAHTVGDLPVVCGGEPPAPTPVVVQGASIQPVQSDPSSVVVALDNTKSNVDTTFSTVIDGVEVAKTTVTSGANIVIGPFFAPGKTVVVLGQDGTELARYIVPSISIVEQSASIQPVQNDPSSVVVNLDNTKSTVDATFTTVIDGVEVAKTIVPVGVAVEIGPFSAPGKTVVVLGQDGAELARYTVPSLPDVPKYNQEASIVVDTTVIGNAEVVLTNNGAEAAEFVIRVDGKDDVTITVNPNESVTKTFEKLPPGANIIVLGQDGAVLDRDKIPTAPSNEQGDLSGSIVQDPENPGTVTVDIDNSDRDTDAHYQIVIDDEVVAEGVVPAGDHVTGLGPWTSPGSTIVVRDGSGNELDRAVIDDTGKAIRVCKSTGRDQGPQYTNGEMTVQEILNEEGDFFDRYIIPKFSYVKGGSYNDYPGLNYTTDNMAVLGHDCVRNVFVEPMPGPATPPEQPSPAPVVALPPVFNGGSSNNYGHVHYGNNVNKGNFSDTVRVDWSKSSIDGSQDTWKASKQLATTGVSTQSGVLFFGAVLLIGAGAAFVLISRRRQKTIAE